MREVSRRDLKELSSKDYISVGKITKPHGVRGFLKFLLYNEDSSMLLDKDFLIIKKDLKSIKLKIENLNLNSSFLLAKRRYLN